MIRNPPRKPPTTREKIELQARRPASQLWLAITAAMLVTWLIGFGINGLIQWGVPFLLGNAVAYLTLVRASLVRAR